jgi:DNA-binding MarR family transcriptional regulator
MSRQLPDDHVDRVRAQWARERPDLDTAAMALVARLGRLREYIDDGLERAFAEHGLSRSAWDVLASLRRSGPPYRLSPTDLYQGLMRTSGAMTHRLHRLEQAGLVERIADPDDGRSLLVGLTRRGRALVDRVAPIHLETERRLLAALDPAEQQRLAALLKKLLVSFEREQPVAPGRVPRRGRRRRARRL